MGNGVLAFETSNPIKSRARGWGTRFVRRRVHPFSHPAAAGGSPPAPRGGRDVERPRPILQRQHGHDFEAQDMSAVTSIALLLFEGVEISALKVMPFDGRSL